MAGKHKVLWHDGWIGELRALKKDPTKTSFWLALFFKKKSRRGELAGFYELHSIPVYILQERINEFSEEVNWSLHGCYIEYRSRLEQALDYLFAELGRRANRKVIS